MDNLFLVASPYQLINATEARYKLGCEASSCLILILNGKDSEIAQLRKMASALDWHSVFEFSGFKKKLFYSFLLRLAFIWSLYFKVGRKIKRVFVGDFNVSFFHYVVSAVNPCEVVILDDGAATLSVYSDYLSKGKRFPRRGNLILDLFELTIFFPFSTCLLRERKVLLFTSYDLKRIDCVQVMHNDFEYLKKSRKRGEFQGDLVWLIGSPYSEAGIMDLESELLLIRRAVDFLRVRGYEVHYYAHRRDSDYKLAGVSDIRTLTSLKRSLFPIEYEYCVCSSVKPGTIAGFYTTALDTLDKLGSFKDIYSFQIPDVFLNERTASVYEHYRRCGFSVLKL